MKYWKLIVLGLVLIIAAVFLQFITAEPAKQQRQISQGPSMEKEFEDVLNGFLRAVSEETREYKKQRKVLGELIKPENLRSPEYIEQNYQMAQDLLSKLHNQMDEVMGVFSKTDQEIKSLLQDQSQETKKIILNRWAALKDKQARRYVAFFEIEDDVLLVYEELVRFYYTKQHVFNVDVSNNKIVFEQYGDDLRSKELLAQLDDLSRKQREVLRQTN